MKRMFTICALVAALSAQPAYADNFRCPNGSIVSTGDSIATVAAKCDPPADRFRREEPMAVDVTGADSRTGTKIIYIDVQEWLYNQGSTLLHTLLFRNGILAEVRTGGFVR